MPALILTIILIPVFWMLIIRPQQRRQREHAELVASLVPGDHVEAFSGIRGTLVAVEPATVRIEIAEGVVVTMARLAVAGRVEPGGDDDGQDDDVHHVNEADPTTDEQSATTDGELA